MADLLRGNRVQCQLGGSGHLCECLHCCRDFWVEGQQRHAADRIVRTDCVVAFQYHDDVILKLIIICLTHTTLKLKKHCFEILKGRIRAILAKINKNKFLFLKTLLTLISSSFPYCQ